MSGTGTQAPVTSGNFPALLSLKDTCRELGNVSERHIRNLMADGRLERVYEGRRAMVTGESLAAYIERLKVAARQKTGAGAVTHPSPDH
jgi:hypothetical protein